MCLHRRPVSWIPYLHCIMNEKISNFGELRSLLVDLKEEQPGDLIIVKADEAVAHGIVVRVMDIAKTAGFSRIAIATK